MGRVSRTPSGVGEQTGMLSRSESGLWSTLQVRGMEMEREKADKEWQSRLMAGRAMVDLETSSPKHLMDSPENQKEMPPGGEDAAKDTTIRPRTPTRSSPRLRSDDGYHHCTGEDSTSRDSSYHAHELQKGRELDSEDKKLGREALPGDLKGTTSAMSRKMTDEEHEIMLYKRKLRNRQSAARSRKRHQMILHNLQSDIQTLTKQSDDIMAACESCASDNGSLREANMRLYCENAYLRAQLSVLMNQPASGPSMSQVTVGETGMNGGSSSRGKSRK